MNEAMTASIGVKPFEAVSFVLLPETTLFARSLKRWRWFSLLNLSMVMAV